MFFRFNLYADSSLTFKILLKIFTDEEKEKFKKMEKEGFNLNCEGFNKWLIQQKKEPIKSNERDKGNFFVKSFF